MKRTFSLLFLVAALVGGLTVYAQNVAAALAVAPTPAPKLHFFVKLIPPRPTFADDMTPVEEKLMQEHADYWAAEFTKGTVLIIGPVLDPRGAWGMAVLETATEEEARTLAMNDPTVKSGLNKVEISPMRVFRIQK
jgi:uncharacterized protein YciI